MKVIKICSDCAGENYFDLRSQMMPFYRGSYEAKIKICSNSDCSKTFLDPLVEFESDR